MSDISPESTIPANANINDDLTKCTICDRTFRSNRGLNQHLRSNQHLRTCQSKSKENVSNVIPATLTAEEDASLSEIIDIESNVSTDRLHYKWGNFPDNIFEKNVSIVYEKVVYWKKNMFLLPSGRAGKQYVDETTRLMNEWLHDSPMKDIAFKAIMIMPNLLLQKPSKKSKSKDHLKALERRIELWTSGELMELLYEAETIQKSLTSTNRPKTIAEISKKFIREMQNGNVNGAMKLLTDNMQNGILPLNENTLNQLEQKHPQGKKADVDVLLTDIPEKVHPIKYECIDADMIRRAAAKTKGGAGPSGLDANGWNRILTSKSFGNSSTDLCKTFAEVIKKLCTVKCQSSALETYLACRLIPLDKNSGLRPIGIGEILRRIAGKVIVSAIQKDIVSSVGSLQVCAGHEAGCEAIIHAMHSIFEEESSEAVLLVDASNAFNSVNREAFLHNVSIICPPISTYVQNCYSVHSRLFIIGGGEIKSTEGTTQGDPIAMAVYAIATIPLILMIVEITCHADNTTKTAAYADDITAAGKIIQLKHWWDTLCELGPKFGYYPEARKSWLIIKEHTREHANVIFKDTNIQISSEGQRHLGAVIGSVKYKHDYIQEKIDLWIRELRVLCKIASTEPHAAYTGFITGFKHKVSYFMRTIPNISDQLKKFDDVVSTEFLPAITGGINCSDIERKLMSLPPKLGGLGIPIFSEITDQEFNNSVLLSNDLSTKIQNQQRKYDPNNETPNVKNKNKSYETTTL